LYLPAFLEIPTNFPPAFLTSLKSSQTRQIQRKTPVSSHSKMTSWDDLKIKKPRQNAAWDDLTPKITPAALRGVRIPEFRSRLRFTFYVSTLQPVFL